MACSSLRCQSGCAPPNGATAYSTTDRLSGSSKPELFRISRSVACARLIEQHLTQLGALRTRFDRIFRRRTDFVTLDRLLARLHANKAELLAVLDHPDIPLHTNGSENDIRCQVTKRKVSGGTRSDVGRDCRDAFLGLAKTCAKLGVAFWDYLGNRLGMAGQPAVPPLPDLIRCRGQPA